MNMLVDCVDSSSKCRTIDCGSPYESIEKGNGGFQNDDIPFYNERDPSQCKKFVHGPRTKFNVDFPLQVLDLASSSQNSAQDLMNPTESDYMAMMKVPSHQYYQ